MINIPQDNSNTKNSKNPLNPQDELIKKDLQIQALSEELLAEKEKNALLARQNQRLEESLKNSQSPSEEQSRVCTLEDDVSFLLNEISLAHHNFVLISNDLRKTLAEMADFKEAYPFLEQLAQRVDKALKLADDARVRFSFDGRGRESRRGKKAPDNPPGAADYGQTLKTAEELETEIQSPEFDSAKATKKVQALKKAYMETAAGNQKLQGQLKKAKAQASRNNQDSHVPSGKMLRFRAAANERLPSDNPAGGVEGHPGHWLDLESPDAVDKVVRLYPQGCDKDSPGLEVGEKRYLINEYVILEITCYEQMVARDGRETVKAEFPPGIKARVQYGNTVVTNATALNIVGMMSKTKVGEYLGEEFGLPISTSTIINMITKAAEMVAPVEEELRKRLRDAPVVHFDETPVGVNKNDVYVHTAVSDNYVLLKRGTNRGELGADDLGVAKNMKGIAVSDRFSLYLGKYFAKIPQAFCHSHLIRDLNYIVKLHPELVWPKKIRNTFRLMNLAAKQAREEGLKEIPPETYTLLMREYFDALETGFEETVGFDRKEDPETLNLLDALEKYWLECCRFFDNLQVPFTNNPAETSLRSLKVAEKVSGPFRSERGLDSELVLRSYVQTAIKQGLNPITALAQAVNGNPMYIFTHEAVENSAATIPKLKVRSNLAKSKKNKAHNQG